MTIMTIRIPDDVAAAFDKAFEGQDKDAVIAQIIRKALENRELDGSLGQGASKLDLVSEFRKLRQSMPSVSQDEIRKIREDLRK